MTITDGKNTMTTTGIMDGHWLGAECTKTE